MAPFVLTPVVPQWHSWPRGLLPLLILSLTSSGWAYLCRPTTCIVRGRRLDLVMTPSLSTCVFYTASPLRTEIPSCWRRPGVTPASGLCLISCVFSPPGPLWLEPVPAGRCRPHQPPSLVSPLCLARALSACVFGSSPETPLTYFADLMSWNSTDPIFTSWLSCLSVVLDAQLSPRPSPFYYSRCLFSSSTAKRLLK